MKKEIINFKLNKVSYLKTKKRFEKNKILKNKYGKIENLLNKIWYFENKKIEKINLEKGQHKFNVWGQLKSYDLNIKFYKYLVGFDQKVIYYWNEFYYENLNNKNNLGVFAIDLTYEIIK